MAREFNGTSQGAEAASVDLSGVLTASVSFWLYAAAWGGAGTFQRIVHFTDDPDASLTGFLFYDNADEDVFYLQTTGDGGDNQKKVARPSTSAWHHYGLVIDRSQAANEVLIYLDGSSVGTVVGQNNNTTNLSQSTLHLMSFNETSDWKAGRMAVVGIWNTVLSGANFTSLAGTLGVANSAALPTSIPSGLKGYWRLAGTTSPEPDTSGAGHDMTLTAAPTQVADPIEPNFSGSGAATVILGRRRRV